MPSRSSSGSDRSSDTSRASNKAGSSSSASNSTSGSTGGGKRGFAAMDPREQREIAHEGGQAVSRDRAHMAEIGRKGALARNAGRSASRISSSRQEPGGPGGSQHNSNS